MAATGPWPQCPACLAADSMVGAPVLRRDPTTGVWWYIFFCGLCLAQSGAIASEDDEPELLYLLDRHVIPAD